MVRNSTATSGLPCAALKQAFASASGNPIPVRFDMTSAGNSSCSDDDDVVVVASGDAIVVVVAVTGVVTSLVDAVAEAFLGAAAVGFVSSFLDVCVTGFGVAGTAAAFFAFPHTFQFFSIFTKKFKYHSMIMM